MTPSRIIAAAVSIACLASATPALATTALTVLPVQGFPGCDLFAMNVNQLSQSSPEGNFTLTDNGQTIDASVSDDGQSLSWNSTLPVNYVIVGGETRSNIFLFGDGTVFDIEESAPSTSAILQVRFCFGADLPDGGPLPPCSSLENGPLCPVVDGDEGQERNGTLIFFDFDEPFFGVGSGESQCTCGNVQLEDCAEGLPAESGNTCAGGELLELPVIVEGVKNSRDGGPEATTVCKTVDGVRECVSN
jgi:hypothetical protein